MPCAPATAIARSRRPRHYLFVELALYARLPILPALSDRAVQPRYWRSPTVLLSVLPAHVYRVASTSAFAGCRWPPEIILTAVRWYLGHPLSAPRTCSQVVRCGHRL